MAPHIVMMNELINSPHKHVSRMNYDGIVYGLGIIDVHTDDQTIHTITENARIAINLGYKRGTLMLGNRGYHWIYPHFTTLLENIKALDGDFMVYIDADLKFVRAFNMLNKWVGFCLNYNSMWNRGYDFRDPIEVSWLIQEHLPKKNIVVIVNDCPTEINKLEKIPEPIWASDPRGKIWPDNKEIWYRLSDFLLGSPSFRIPQN